MNAHSLPVRRLNAGAPILAPTENGWESGVTFNAGVILLTRREGHGRVLQNLLTSAGSQIEPPQELVAILYRARPRRDPGYLVNRSFIGLALFDTQLRLIHRFCQPVMTPSAEAAAPDYLGVEDPRISCIDGKILMVYCGCGLAGSTWRATLCAAESEDLLTWRKSGPMNLRLAQSDPRVHVNNKDGALFPDCLDGWYYLLHRPMIGRISDWSIHLARSRDLGGPWDDLGPIMRAKPRTGWSDTWLGAGAAPLPLGDRRYLEIYHIGHLAADGSRLYTLGAAVLDLSQVDSSDPARIVHSRLDHFMAPQTQWEIEGPYPDSIGNVLFTCGAYEHDDDIRIIYGGGDTYVMAADVNRAELLAALEAAPPSKIVGREN